MTWLGGILVGIGLTTIVVAAIAEPRMTEPAARWAVVLSCGLIVAGALMA